MAPAERLAPVMAPLRKGCAPWLPGWRVRVVDGNHLPASEKRVLYDVFDSGGRLVERYALPEGSRLVGFGKDVIYVSRQTDDGQRLEGFVVRE